MKNIRKTSYFIDENGGVYNKYGKRLRQRLSDGRYLRVTIYINSKRVDLSAHRLVAEYYVPNPDNKPFVNHINCNKTDNRACNLEWVSHQENMDHAKQNNLLPRGNSSHRCKYPDELIHEICKMLVTGVSRKEIMQITGVSKSTLVHIWNKRVRCDISDKYFRR